MTSKDDYVHCFLRTALKRFTRVKILHNELIFEDDGKEIHQSRNWKYDGACDETLSGKGDEKQTISCRLTVYINIYLLTM